MTKVRGFTEEQSNLYDAIKTVWKQKGWEWDTSVGAAAKRLAPIICSIITKELSEFQALIEETRKVVDAREKEMFASDRAKDAAALCKELKRAGLSEDNISYNVYAFLAGDIKTTPPANKRPNDNVNENENIINSPCTRKPSFASNSPKYRI